MNLYATPHEIKMALADGIREHVTSYDDILYRLSQRVSRMIDRHCFRFFYPQLETRYYDGDGGTELWVKDLFSLTTLSYSTNLGQTYIDFTANDYFLTVAGARHGKGSYTLIVMNPNALATMHYIPAGSNSIRIVGTWGCTDDREAAWEDSGDTSENNPLAAIGTSLTVNDADGADLFGIIPRFQTGQLLKIESEFVELTALNLTANTGTILRGRNGSTAAAHAQNTPIYIWRTPADVKQAAIIQAVRALERGFQGFGDTRASPEIGQMFQMKALDPEAQMLLEPFVWYGD